MIVVDNFELMKSLIKFNDQTKDIILVWVVKRNKDGNTEAKGNNKNRTIKSYHLQSWEQFNNSKNEIIELCQKFNCRAYICVNPKPMVNVLFMLQNIVMENLRTQLNNGTSMLLKGMIDSAVMKSGTDGDKLWVIDVDSTDSDVVQDAVSRVESGQSKYGKGCNVVNMVPTAHGFHIISHPFDTRVMEGSDFEIKKDGLTLLYAYLNN